MTVVAGGEARGRPTRVLVSGPALKFLGPVEAALRQAHAVVRFDRWAGPSAHDPARTRTLQSWAEVVLAEWCLGNAVTLSEQRRADQRLMIRLHRFEVERAEPGRIDPEQVDLLTVPGPHLRAQLLERVGWPSERCAWVPNAVDVAAAPTHKTPDADRTLALVGWYRQLKRLDRALDLLEALLDADPSWRLICKGEHPWSVPWVWRDRRHRRWLEGQLDRIASSDRLSRSVRFEGHGPIDALWPRTGWVLSPSDVESFHLAAAEGMAAAAVPVVWDRPGARELLGSRWVHGDTAAAADAVLALSGQARQEEGLVARAHIARCYDRPRLERVWRSLLLGSAGAASNSDSGSP